MPKPPRKTPLYNILIQFRAGLTDKARTAAKYGRELSALEEQWANFYVSFDDWHAAKQGKRIYFESMKGLQDIPELTNADVDAMEKRFRTNVRKVCNMFLKAVIDHDRKKIIEIADAVWFFKDMHGPMFSGVDPERLKLLTLGDVLRRNNEKMSIRTIAQLLKLDEMVKGEKVKSTQDGYSALRRKCKELNVPLKESRKRRLK